MTGKTSTANELPECLHRLHRAHVAGLVWRETCPACHGDGCYECDQTGMVEELLSPAEARRRGVNNQRGYFSIGIYHPKHGVNIGTLLRSAYQMGAAFVFTIGRRYEKQAADTTQAWRHLPVVHYQDFDDFRSHLPLACPVVAVEMGGVSLSAFAHPERCVYLLGAEDHGLPQGVLDKCHYVVSLDAVRTPSYNVAVAGSLVMYDRMGQRTEVEASTC